VARHLPAEISVPGTANPTLSSNSIVARLTALLVAGAMCLTVAACTRQGDEAGDGTPRCEDTVSMQVPTELALRAATSGCLHEEGQLTTYETTTVHCVDGRALHWNETGWGYDDGTWHPREFNQTVPVPQRNVRPASPRGAFGFATLTPHRSDAMKERGLRSS
jgi:hypothetical protein